MRQRKQNRGFTLVELMVVLAILVVLVAMVGPRLLGTQKKADIKATIQQISNLESALKLYAVDNRTYPSSEDGLKALMEKPAESEKALGWQGPYLDAESLPVDPWGNQFKYEFPPTNGVRKDFPNIWSVGPDGEDNTDDDIKNWKSEGSEDGEPTVDEIMDEPAPEPMTEPSNRP